MTTTARALDLPATSPAAGWTVSLTHEGDTYTVTLHANSDVIAYTGAGAVAAQIAYDCITARRVYVDAWNRAVNA